VTEVIPENWNANSAPSDVTLFGITTLIAPVSRKAKPPIVFSVLGKVTTPEIEAPLKPIPLAAAAAMLVTPSGTATVPVQLV
jgi:hypothetical protein